MSSQRDENDGAMPEDVRAALESWNVPPARAEFRSDLRASFLAGAAEVTEDDVVGHLADWDVPEARSEFRKNMRAEFMAAGEAPVAGTAAGKLFSFPRAALALVAAAAAVLLIATLNRPAQPSWKVIDFAQGASFQLNGDDVSSAADSRVSEALESGGCALATGEQNLALIHLGEGVLLEFPAETELRFPPRPEGESGLFEVEVLKGGLRVATTEDFQGRVLVYTPDATISLSGHSLGIDVLPEGTCLCILGGSADLRRRGDESEDPITLGSMSTAFVLRDGEVLRPPAGEVHHLAELQEFAKLGEKHLY